MMGLYQLKEFLTLDDVADYLRDKGICDFDLTNGYDKSKLNDFVIDLYQRNQLTPVFDYDGYIIAIEKNIYDYDIDTYKGKMQASYAMIQSWRKSKAITYKPFKGQFDPFQDAFVNERYKKYIDDGKKIILYADNRDDDVTEVEFLYPKEQLVAIFEQTPYNNEQQQIADLQAENARLQARIAELENEFNDTFQSRQGVGKAKILAKEVAKHVAKKLWEEDKDKKIKVTEMATAVYVELQKCYLADQLTDQAVSLKDWIRDIAPEYARKGGRPKNEP